MGNKNVYLLYGGCVGDRYVIGVFTSKKRVDEERTRIIKTDNFYRRNPDCLEIEQYDVNICKYNK